MLPNIAKLQPMLERMTGPQLQQFAAMHHDDAVAVGLAMQIDRDRKEEIARLQGLMTGQKQPTVVDQAIQALGGQQQPQQPPQGIGAPPQGAPQGAPQGIGAPPPPPAPEEQGIGQLPAPNMEQMADGGIAGYADGGEVQRFDVGGVAQNYAQEIAARRASLARMGVPQKDIDEDIAAFIRDRTSGSTDATSDVSKTSSVGVPQFVITGQSTYAGSANPPMIPNARMTGETPAVGPNDPGKAFTQRNIAEAAARVPELRNFIASVENAPYSGAPIQPVVAKKEDKAPPASTYKPAGIATLKAPAVPDIVTPKLTNTTYEVGEKPTVAASKADVGQLADSSDLMTNVEGAQAGLRKMGNDLLKYYDENKPKKDVFSETVKRLDKEDALAVDKKGQAQGMALMMAGFKMMESPYGGRGLGALLRNAGAGAKIGAENYNSAIDKLEAAAEKRAQQRTTIEAAQDAAARGDFNARLGLVQHGQQLKAQADALGISAAQTIFGTNATVGATLYSNALSTYNTNKNVAAQLSQAQNLAQFNAEGADKRAVFGARMDMLKAQYEQAGANARAMAPTAEMRMALALGGGNLEVGLRKAAEIAAGRTDLAKLYLQSKTEFDAKNMDSNKQFMSPQEFMSLYNQVTTMRSPPAPTGTPTGRILR